jgi:hypothetical protein
VSRTRNKQKCSKCKHQCLINNMYHIHTSLLCGACLNLFWKSHWRIYQITESEDLRYQIVKMFLRGQDV